MYSRPVCVLQLSTMNATQESLQKELLLERARSAELSSQNLGLQNDLDEMHHRAQETQTENDRLSKALDEALGVREKHGAEVSELQGKLEAATARVEEAKAQLAEAKSQLASALRRVAELEKRLAQLQGQVCQHA